MTSSRRDQGTSPSAAPSPVGAAIDIGTNSIHMVVARSGPGGAFDIITREKESVRLGRGAGEMDHLAPDAIDRGIATLTRFRLLADRFDARVRAVATSAVREAVNRGELIDRARREAGIEIEVISGVEEARLIHLAVLHAVPVRDRAHLTVDIGGGSTEFVAAKGTEVRLARSVKLGAIRLTDRFFPGGAVAPGQVAACRAYIRSYLSPLAHDLRREPMEVAVGSSGTVLAVAAMAEHARGRIPTRGVNNVTFTRGDLGTVLDRILAAPTAAQRRHVAGLDERRADIITGGALLLEQVMDLLGLDAMVTSEYALREGVLIDRFSQRARDRLHHLSDIRRDAVAGLVARYERDADHAARSTDLALQLFEATGELHGLGDAERDLLEAGGLLHNVGLFISHSAHQKHSAYVIRHSDQLVGFTDHEIELMALVARYHRKSAPSRQHPEFRALKPQDQRVVRILAGLLRLGIALDRSHAGVVTGVQAHVADGQLTVAPQVRPGVDAGLELYAATERKSLLEEALGVAVRIDGARP